MYARPKVSRSKRVRHLQMQWIWTVFKKKYILGNPYKDGVEHSGSTAVYCAVTCELLITAATSSCQAVLPHATGGGR